MQTFSLNFTSRLHFVLFILSGIILSGVGIGVLSYYAGLGGLAEILAIVFVIYVFLKAGKFSKQQVNLSITDQTFNIEWGKGPWFSKKKKQQQVEWSNVESYKLEPDRLFDVFVLKLHTGEKLQFSISKLNDQEKYFRGFYGAFLKKVESLEQANSGEGRITIEKAKTFYETTIGMVFIFLMAAALIGAFVYSIFK